MIKLISTFGRRAGSRCLNKGHKERRKSFRYNCHLFFEKVVWKYLCVNKWGKNPRHRVNYPQSYFHTGVNDFPDRLLKGNKSVKLNMSLSISTFYVIIILSFLRCKDTHYLLIIFAAFILSITTVSFSI